MAGNQRTIIIVVVIVLILLCCCCVGGVGAWWLWNNGDRLMGVGGTSQVLPLVLSAL